MYRKIAPLSSFFYQLVQRAIMDPTVLRCAVTFAEFHRDATGKPESVKVDVRRDGNNLNVQNVSMF